MWRKPGPSTGGRWVPGIFNRLLCRILSRIRAELHGWSALRLARAMFWCALTPVIVAFIVLRRVKEPERWQRKASAHAIRKHGSLRAIFSPPYTRRTLVNTVLLASAICGLWTGAVYVPTAIIARAKRAGMMQAQAVRVSSFGMGLLSLGTILGSLAVPPLAERLGRKVTLAIYFLGMATCILLCFGCAFYLPQGLRPFITVLFFLGFFAGNFATFSLWLPEQYDTGACYCLRIHYFVWTIHRRACELRRRCIGWPNGHARDASGYHRNCLRNWSARDSVWRGDAR